MNKALAWGIGFASALGVGAPMGQAASNGTVGATSIGTISLTTTITGPQVQITGLQDLTWTDTSPLASSFSPCLKASTPTVRLTVSSLHGGAVGLFKMTNSAGAELTYQVGLTQNGIGIQRSIQSSFNGLTPVALTGACNSAIELTFTRSAQTTPSDAIGVLTDTMTLLLSPE